MERLGTDDPVKGQLLKKSVRHREQLEDEVKLISERTEKIITNAVIIGGALAVTYFLVRQFSGSNSKKKSKAAKIKLVQSKESDELPVAAEEMEAPGIITQIGTALASQATVFLLQIAKEKLGEYLQAQAAKKSAGNEHS
jgi:hypothetical protein